MKAVTAILVVCALLVFGLGDAFAAKKVQGTTAGQWPVEQKVEREFIPDPSAVPQGEVVPVPPRAPSNAILAPILSGTYTIGVGGTYTKLSDAVFDLQTNGIAIGANVIFQFIDPLYTDTSQTIGNYLNQATGTVLFRPAPGVTAVIRVSGGLTANAWCLRIDNATNLTWDGSNAGGTDRSLTLEADTVAPSRNVINIQRGSSFVTIKNMILKGNRRAASGSLDLVRVINQGLTPAATAANHDILIQNNWIYRGNGGIVVRGKDASLPDYNVTLRGNLVGGASSPALLDNLASSAIITEACLNILVTENEVNGVKVLGASPFGIQARGAVTGLYEKNKVHNIVTLGGNVRPNGILVGNTVVGVAAGFFIKTDVTFQNNMFYDLHNLDYLTGSNTRSFDGIIWNPTGAPNSTTGNGATIRLYHNTFYYRMYGGAEGAAAANTGFMVDGNFAGSNTTFAHIDSIILRNNIFATQRDTGFTRQMLWFRPADTLASSQFKVVSNNNLFWNTDGGFFAQYNNDPWPYGPTTVVTLFPAWQTASGLDGGSKFDNPQFISATDPHIATPLGLVSPAESLGVGVGVLTDIDNQPRDAFRPDAGADEFTPNYVNDEIQPIAFVDPTGPSQIKKAATPFSPKATFRNNGLVNKPTAPVRYQILNSVPSVVYTNDKTVSLNALGGTGTVTFDPVPGGLAAGTYTIRAITTLGTDQIPSNDTLVSTMQVQAVVSAFPYTQNFEGTAAGWLTAGTANDWVIGTPAKTQLNGAHAGTKAMVTKTTGNYSDNQESYVFAPILDLTTFTGLFTVQFYSNFKTENEWDGGVLELSTDGGYTWSRVDSTLGTGPNFNTPISGSWYNNGVAQGNISAPFWSGGHTGGIGSNGYSSQVNNWIVSSSLVPGVAGLSDVRFRWHFSADGAENSEGWALDDITFKRVEDNDLALSSLGIPGYTGGPVPEKVTMPEPVTKGRNGHTDPVIESVSSLGALTAGPINFAAVVQNAGANPQPAYSVGWEIDAASQAPVASPAPLPFGGIQNFTLTWAAPTTGFHNVRAYTQLGTDTNPSNDTASFNFEVLAPNVVFYEGFNGTTFPPTNWDTLNVDGNTGSVTSWYRSTGSPKEGVASARANFNGANGFYIDEWLITPNTGGLLDVSYTVDSLTFYAKNFDGSVYPESLMVMISTTTPEPENFTLVLGYFEVPPGPGYTKFTFALPNSANRYIAFRRLIYDGGPTGNNSDNLYLDDVRISRYAFANVFQATPANLNFGSLPLGYTSAQTVKVKNTGNLPLNLSSVTASNPTDFAIAATPGVIAAGDSTTVTVTFQPATTGLKTTDIIFVHDADSTPDTVTASGTATNALLFLSVVPDTIIAKDPVKGKLLKPVKRVKPGKPIIGPNWANLLDETVAQGGFRPGATESDSAGGMVVGKSLIENVGGKWKPIKDSAKVRAWVRLTKWDSKKSVGKSFNALQKTLEDKTGKHTLLPARGFDFTTDGKNKPLKGQMTSLTPKKQSNPLFAQLVALKLNIAASQLGKIPAGFGELVFDRNTSMFDEKTVAQIAAEVDQMMTYWQLSDSADFADAYTTVRDINKAYVGVLDTVSFMTPDSLHPLGKLELKGQVNAASVSYLKLPAVFIATRMNPSSPEVESGEDFEDESDLVDGELPVAAKLYQNYPNPFNPSTTIAFRLREDSKVSIRIFNLLGQQVATLLNGEEVGEGYQTVEFSATNLASGLYFYQIDAQGLGDEAMKTIETRKMLLVK